MIKRIKNSISFEFFPPKKELDVDKTISVIDELSKYHPDFMSVTYGAMGNSNQKSFDILKHIISLGIEPLAHFTCVGSGPDDTREFLEHLKSLGVHNILALRGDLPDGYIPSRLDFIHASDLISFIKSEYKGEFSVAAAAYPESHYESVSFDADLDFLKKKQDLGADFFITQLFFDNNMFYRFLTKCRAHGITIPIIPGVMPITSYTSIQRLLTKTSTVVPRNLYTLFNTYKNNRDIIKEVGLTITAQQIQDLVANDVDGLHIYSMNNSDNTERLLSLVNSTLSYYKENGKD